MSDWWRGSVTYQIYPRSFQDSNGDGIGDLRGITERLGYVADLGVDAIWLSPIFVSPMADMGYDVSDYTDIDPIFGSLADFDAMVARAHELGLKVIIDQVLSHSSDQHPFFKESRASRDNPKADWYVWADPKHDGSPPNNWISIFGGPAWAWDTRRRQYYFHNFLAEQPDFNFHNPDVQDWLLGTMRFWLDRGVDGFRLDTVNFYFHDKLLRDDPADYRRKDEPESNPYDMQYHIFSKNQPDNLIFLERMRALLDEYEARAMVGEVGESHHPIRMMGEYTSGKRLQKAYSFEMLGTPFNAAPLPQPDRGLLRGRAERLADLGVLEPRRAAACQPVGAAWHRQRAARQACLCAAPVDGGLDLPLPGGGARADRDRARVLRAHRPAGHQLLARAGRARRLPDADGLGRGQCLLGLLDRAALAADQGRPGRPPRGGAGGRPGVGPRVLPDDAEAPARHRGAAERPVTLLRRGRAGARLHAGRERPLPLQPVAGEARGAGDRRRRAGAGAGGGARRGWAGDAAPERLRDHGGDRGRRGQRLSPSA